MDGLAVNATNVEEYVRETLGEDTCDARHSVSDPESGGGMRVWLVGQCSGRDKCACGTAVTVAVVVHDVPVVLAMPAA